MSATPCHREQDGVDPGDGLADRGRSRTATQPSGQQPGLVLRSPGDGDLVPRSRPAADLFAHTRDPVVLVALHSGPWSCRSARKSPSPE
ncbi:hypothetical protein [Nocardia xishanensis]